MCGLGRDATGAFVKQHGKACGIDMSLVQYDQDVTPVSVVVIDSDAQRKFISPPMSRALFFKPVLDAIRDVRAVSIGSLGVPPFGDPLVVLDVLRAAKAAGAITFADMMTHSDAPRLEEIAEALPLIDYLLPNEEEAAHYTKKTDLDEMADTFLRMGVGNVVIKTGVRGCFAKSAEQRVLTPSYRVTAVDTTGAGDNFVAGFISARLEEKPLDECCQFACGVASIAVQSIGAATGVKNREHVLSTMAEYEKNAL